MSEFSQFMHGYWWLIALFFLFCALVFFRLSGASIRRRQDRRWITSTRTQERRAMATYNDWENK